MPKITKRLVISKNTGGIVKRETTEISDTEYRNLSKSILTYVTNKILEEMVNSNRKEYNP
ncbi:MAG: hypothetical protein ACYDG2_12200 [Ruminiclostridium sp.]